MVSIVASTSKSANSLAMCPSKSAPRSEFEFAADMDLSPLGAFWIFIGFSPRIAFPALFMSDCRIRLSSQKVALRRPATHHAGVPDAQTCHDVRFRPIHYCPVRMHDERV